MSTKKLVTIGLKRTSNYYLGRSTFEFDSVNLFQIGLLSINGTVINRRTFSSTSTTPATHVAAAPVENDSLWVRSPFPDIQPIVGQTVPEYLWGQARQWGTATAYECGITGRKYDFNQLYRYSRGFAAGLIKSGAERGQVMSLVLPNMPEYPIALLGSWDAGLIVSTINPGYTPHEITRQLVNSETKYVVTVAQYLPSVLKARESYPQLKKIIVMDIDEKAPEGCLSFFEMAKTDPQGFDFLKGSEIDTTTTTAFLPYSSGTTGPPKGVKLSHHNLTTNVEQYLQKDVVTLRSLADEGIKGQERIIGLVPFFHVSGMHRFNLVTIHRGAHCLTLPKFDPVTFVRAIKNHKPTVLSLVPPLLNFVCQTPDIEKKDLESIRTIIAGTAPVGPVLINKLLTKADKYIFFQEAYGMTEFSPMVLMLNPSSKNSKIGSSGTPIPNTICKIIDPKTGTALGPNERGELCLKGPQMMLGYLKNDKATAETIDPQGWLHTGDIAYYDDDKHFYIVDRLKELIKVKGFQVAPSELEDLLRENDKVTDVAVIGVPDERSGELPRAYIVRKSVELTADKINEFLKDKLIGYKQLKGGIEFVDTIPKAPSGKILRRELLAEYKKIRGL